MKRIITIMAVAALFAGAASAKKDKKKAAVEQPAPVVVLASGSDSISYACGYQHTNGLIDFLLQQKMDTAYIADFVRGFKEAISKTDDPSFKAYSMGLNIAEQVKGRMLPGVENELAGSPDSINQALYFEGFFAALAGDTTFFKMDDAEKYFRTRLEADKEAKKEALYGQNRRDGEAFLAENSKKEGVVTLPSGLQYKVLVEGTGVKPSTTEEVTVKYEGKLVDGTVFDSSYKRSEQTNKFRANQVIKGWTEALSLMPTGSTWELYIPYELAYGDRDMGQIPPYSALIFKVELIDCDSAQAAAKAAEEAAAAEKAAKKPAKKGTKRK